MKVISKKLVRKVLELMKRLAKEDDTGETDDEDDDEKEEKEEKEDDEEKEEKKDKEEETMWYKFYKEFAKNLKMGCYDDDSNRSKISKLFRFFTTKSDDKEIILTSISTACRRLKRVFTTCRATPWIP